jgi:hypothetical protein
VAEQNETPVPSPNTDESSPYDWAADLFGTSDRIWVSQEELQKEHRERQRFLAERVKQWELKRISSHHFMY